MTPSDVGGRKHPDFWSKVRGALSYTELPVSYTESPVYCGLSSPATGAGGRESIDGSARPALGTLVDAETRGDDPRTAALA